MSDDVIGDTELDGDALKQMIKDSEDQYTKLINHPCEEVFDIEPGTTELIVEPPRQTELVQAFAYDDKDKEIEENYQEIFDRAMDTFDDIQRDVEGLEGKYKARNHEVGAQFLNAALNAAKEKQRIKEHKDKMTSGSGSAGQAGSTNNTQINVATSTADLVKMLQQQNGGLVAQNLSDTEGLENDDEEVVEEVEEKPTQRKTIKRSKTD